MCMVNMLFKKDISKEILTELFNRHNVHSMSNYQYIERLNKINSLPQQEKSIENEKFKKDLKAFSQKDKIEKSDIVYHNFDAYPDYNVVGMFPEILYKRDFTSLGHSAELFAMENLVNQRSNGKYSFDENFLDDNECLYYSEDRYNLYYEDVKHWYKLFYSMLMEYDMDNIGIYYMYFERAEEPLISKKIKLSDFSGRDLITMEVNRILFIEK